MSRSRRRLLWWLGSLAIPGFLACGSGSGTMDGGEIARPVVPDAAIDPPQTVKVATTAFGQGTQDYTCQALDGGYGWSAAVPDAMLYGGSDATAPQVGTHSAGPTWTWEDGSSVVGDASKKVTITVDPTAVVWLLMPAKSNAGMGVLTSVSFIQRVSTSGGLAPAASSCSASSVGMVSKSPYHASYYFYEPR